MCEEVTSIHEEVVLHRIQSIHKFTLVENHIQQLLRAPDVSLVYVLIHFKLVFGSLILLVIQLI